MLLQDEEEDEQNEMLSDHMKDSEVTLPLFFGLFFKVSA